MTNEEKILKALGALTDRFDKMESHFDNMEARMDRLEENQKEMRTTLTKVAVTQENIVLQQLKLLAEGHEALMATLAPKSRVEALEDDVALLKQIIRSMSQEIFELKKAQ